MLQPITLCKFYTACHAFCGDMAKDHANFTAHTLTVSNN